MAAVWTACETAGVDIPDDVLDFFDGDERGPDQPGAVIDIEQAVTAYVDDAQQGYDVDITKLPKSLRIIRFYNAW